MHMNSVPHLLNEDRPEFERVLDEALRTAADHPELAGAGQRLNSVQLRTLALSATAFITGAAAAEYQHYVRLREQDREPPLDPSRQGAAGEKPAPESPTVSGTSIETSSGVSSGSGLAATLGEATESSGAGAVAVVAVLAPVLAGVAAIIFLLVGYLLKLLSPEPVIANALLTAGWVFCVLAAVAILVAGTALLLTALRNSASSVAAEPPSEFHEGPEVAHARDIWREALLKKGILPFFRDLDTATGHRGEPGPVPSQSGVPSPGAQRMPHLGYHRPGFSGPESDGESGTRPHYSSPDFSSPDFGGPDHQPE